MNTAAFTLNEVRETHAPEKLITLLTGADDWCTAALPGIRSMRLSDGPVGVRGGGFERPRSGALLPNPALVASCWDRELAHRLGALIGREARRIGVDWVLAPMLNVPRSPLGGRTFECFSEDPLLTAEMGLHSIRGIQSTGVAATAKHFVANESETSRLEYDVHVGTRTLRQRYLFPFEIAVVEGNVETVMASYNSVNGELVTESRDLLRSVLRDEWGFQGVVVSDWGAARSTESTLLGGLDLVMPGPDGPWGPTLVEALQDGRVAQADIVSSAARIAALATRTDPSKSPLGAEIAESSEHAARERLLLREAVSRGSVLLENRGVLPFTSPKSIALLGPGVRELCLQGGGSAGLEPQYQVQVVDVLRRRLGASTRVEVEAAIDIAVSLRPIARERVAAGFTLVFRDVSGNVLERREIDRAHVVIEQAPKATTSVELRVSAELPEAGVHELSIRGSGSFALSVDAEEPKRIDIATPARDPLSPLVEPGEHRFNLESGTHEIAITLHWDPDEEWHILGLGHREPRSAPEIGINRAMALASAAEIPILIVGTTAEHETEGIDREGLALPGHQDELVERVCAANPRTIVVVNSGAPVLMPWRSLPAAILWVGFPGQEGSEALIDMLLGHEEPGGRLSMTIPASESGLPSVIPLEGALEFTEEEAIGYRSAAPSAYAFGHGLGYTSWSYESVTTTPTEGGGCVVSVTLRNSGERRGRETVQVFRREGRGPSQTLRLVGFENVVADAGERLTVDVCVMSRSLREWTSHGWRLPTTSQRLEIGRSSVDLVLSTELPASPLPTSC